jgi:glycosyltransferase involved in cell wall biosynthesis
VNADAGHLLILNQYVAPDVASTGRIAFDIARAAAGDGQHVTFIAAQPSYLRDQPAAPTRELCEGVHIRRVRMYGVRGRQTRLRRFGGYVIFLAGAAVSGARLCATQPVNTVVCFHNPPFLPLLGALLARKQRRLVCVVFDIHPDVLIATGWMRLPRPVIAIWRWLNRMTFRRAAQIVVLSDGMRQVLVANGVEARKIVVIPVWAQPELVPQPSSAAVRGKLGVADGELMILFTGNMGITQRLDPVAEAAAMLEGAPVRFVFAGSGVQATGWRQRLSRNANVTFLPFQSDADYRQLVAACDVGLVTLANGLERFVVPSRALPFLSAGRPLLAVMNPESEIGRLVRTHACGTCVDTAEGLAHAVQAWLADRAELDVAGYNARRAYESDLDRELLCARYVEVCRRT